MLWSSLITASSEVIEFVSYSTRQIATASPFTVNIPVGVVSGDLLLAFYYHNREEETLIGPVGWTTLISSLDTTRGTFSLYSLVAGGSEPSTYTFQSNDDSNQRVTIAAFRGGQGLANVVGTVASGNATTIVAPSITATEPGLLLAYSSAEGGTQSLVSGPAGMTERILEQSAAPRATLYDLSQLSGSSGTKTFTWSNTGDKLALLIKIY